MPSSLETRCSAIVGIPVDARGLSPAMGYPYHPILPVVSFPTLVYAHSMFFSFSSITSITIYVNYHANRELDSDRRRDRRVTVVIEERFFNGKIVDI